MKYLNRFLTLLILVCIPVYCLSAPKERYDPDSIVEAIAFADRLAGSTWLYNWKGKDYRFRFNEDGTIGILEGWRNIKWVVAGKEDIILEAKTGKMLLRFNNDKTTFYTRDWDGVKSDGRIIK